MKAHTTDLLPLHESLSFVIPYAKTATHGDSASDGTVLCHNSQQIRWHGNRNKIPEKESLYLCIYQQNIGIKIIYANSMQNL